MTFMNVNLLQKSESVSFRPKWRNLVVLLRQKISRLHLRFRFKRHASSFEFLIAILSHVKDLSKRSESAIQYPAIFVGFDVGLSLMSI